MSCSARSSSSLFMAADAVPPGVVITTSIVTFLSGFLLGVYAIRGYLIPPSWAAERKANWTDPVESDESDIDEDETILDHAPNWANGAEADRKQGLRASAAPKTATKTKTGGSKNISEECKLVLVVRTDLGMTKGKIAAQAGHATLACFKTLSKQAAKDPESRAAKILRQWERRGQAKIAVQIKSEDEMLELQGKARSLGITAEVIADAGRTQIDAGSLTVLGVGPAPKSEVDAVTGGLKLL
ncbi:peptidyl-tRNA hydrolase PTH2-domain-containing protein [Podospora australis]|uniref:peptidyl-tRNA hydrolase n=1 Tax=Podospora australis TaxID=1536484 RepID=A0AAN6WMI9_9PEZI|nr:peptidyl-tRNA hydrolase PTH2-domain-containing protein [Podospora australis]